MRHLGMRRPKQVSAADAVALIEDGDHVLLEASGGGVLEPNVLIEALAQRYQNTQSPRDLTLTFCSGVGDRQGSGAGMLAHEGLLSTVIAGHWGMAPALADMIAKESFAAYNLPQGVLAQLLRESAAGRPGLFTRAGLDTFCDPRHGGGKLNASATTDLVELQSLDGQEYLRYKAQAYDIALIRGTTADEQGNITLEHEAARLGVLAAAMAVRNNGGIVLAQVKRVAERHTLPAQRVVVPGHLVDYLVVAPDQRQTVLDENNPAYSGELRVPIGHAGEFPLTERKVVARRATQEIEPGAVVNLGVGMADGVASVAAEEGLLTDFTLTVEQGLVGGVPARGVIFGVSWNPDAMIDAASQFDFYDGGGLDVTCLGFAEIDPEGNVNSSYVNGRAFGAGGFINISQAARKVIFCGTLTAGGLRCQVSDGRLTIQNEGSHRKFVNSVHQRTFSAKQALARGTQVRYITERAVFELSADGLVLIEIAEGFTPDDIAACMDFRPIVSDNLRTMPPEIFAPGLMFGTQGLADSPPVLVSERTT